MFQSCLDKALRKQIQFIIRIFAPNMYTLTDLMGQDAQELWQGKVACQIVNRSHIQVGEFLDGVSVFSFLMIVRDIIRAAYFPVAEMGQPKLTLTGTQVMQLTTLFTMLRSHILEPSSFQQEAILALCQLISVNILEIQDQQVENHHFTTRDEEVFKAFLRLVPQHFMEHRELSFYADLLNITTTYLSRIVRQMSGRTVQDFLASALVSEAAIRLKTTNRSITQLADDFHFSDQAAFTKFFTRMKGISPKKFRKGK